MTRISAVDNNLMRYKKGIYYKAKKTPFGYAKLDKNIIFRDRDLYIVSNKIKVNRLDNNIRLIKPKIMVTKDNYRYLQILDIIENKYNVKIEKDEYIKLLIEIIEKFNLDLLTLVEYALEYDDVVIRLVASLVKEVKNEIAFK